MTYLLDATLRIERSLANISKNQESLERIVETKIHDLDVKITEVHTIVEKLRHDVDTAELMTVEMREKQLRDTRQYPEDPDTPQCQLHTRGQLTLHILSLLKCHLQSLLH